MVCLITVAIIFRKKLPLDAWSKRWLWYFSLNVLLVFVVIMISGWSLSNGVPLRYFVPVYISMSIALLIVLDNITSSFTKRFMLPVAFAASLVAGAGTLFKLGFITWESRFSKSGQFATPGNIGIVADCWNSYINACAAPELVKATPHELSGSLRNLDVARQVFNQEKIYVIRNQWMDSFPDTLLQFGHTHCRDGEEFEIARWHVCKYKEVSR